MPEKGNQKRLRGEVHGNSKHLPVKPLQCILSVTSLLLTLSAKCTIHDVRHWAWFILHLSLNFCSCRDGSLSVRKDLDALWQNLVGALDRCVLPMCMQAKGWLNTYYFRQFFSKLRFPFCFIIKWHSNDSYFIIFMQNCFFFNVCKEFFFPVVCRYQVSSFWLNE